MLSYVPVSLQQRSRLRSGSNSTIPVSPSPLCFWVEGPLDLFAMRDVLNFVVRRHDALRTCFVPGVEDYAVLLPPDDIDIAFEVRNVGPIDEDTVRRMVVSDLWLGVDLCQGPLMRATVLRQDNLNHVLALTVDHIAFDGVSANTLISDIAALYPPRAAGVLDWTTAVGPAPSSYSDFCATQERLVAGEWGQACRDHWFSRFEEFGHYPPRGWLGPANGAAELEDPHGDTDVRKITRMLGRGVVDQVAAAGRSYSTTKFVVWTALLLRSIARTDCSVEGLVTDVHGRISPSIASTVGLFSHGAPLYAHVGAEQSLGDAVNTVRPGVHEAAKYALPMRDVSRSWLSAREAGGDGSSSLRPFVHFLDESAWRFDRQLGPISLRYFVPYGLAARPGKGEDMLAFKVELMNGSHYLTAQFDGRVNNPDHVARVLDAVLPCE